jgi:hypothetical protein
MLKPESGLSAFTPLRDDLGVRDFTPAEYILGGREDAGLSVKVADDGAELS